MSPARPAGHVAALDGYRAVAVGLVLVHHLGLLLPGPLPAPLVRLAANGWLGVDLFFVLSGYLITGILLRTVGTVHWVRNFWVRRALRILPLYYGVLLLIVVPGALLGRELPFPPWVGFAFLTNFWIAHAERLDLGLLVLWSLAVEEQFYLVWPWIVRVLGRRGLPLAIVSMLLLAPPIRALSLHQLAAAPYFYTWCRMDALGWGALGAWLVHERWTGVVAACGRLWPLVALAGLVAGTTVAWDRTTPLFATWGYTVVAIGSLIVVLGIVDGRRSPSLRLLSTRPMIHVGKVSYGLYLVHDWVFVALQRAIAPQTSSSSVPVVLAVHALAFALAVGVATLVFRVVETPVLAWKDRLAPSPAPPVAARQDELQGHATGA